MDFSDLEISRRTDLASGSGKRVWSMFHFWTLKQGKVGNQPGSHLEGGTCCLHQVPLGNVVVASISQEKFHEIPDILFEERLIRVSSSCKMLYRCASVCVRTPLAQGLRGMERTYDQTKFLT